MFVNLMIVHLTQLQTILSLSDKKCMTVTKLSHQTPIGVFSCYTIKVNNQGVNPMQTMVTDYSYDQLQTIKGFFTEDEWDAIDSALADYQDYGDKESDLMNSIGNKMYQLFSPKFQDENRHPGEWWELIPPLFLLNSFTN